ncbi:hypothetical protein COE78_20300 [Bacillus pseudomycoides]|nr:hypothetical protein CN677_29415 [Bacillus pseudomycoides]PHA87576.1 hypothetical protein COE78_20300 [Bacillus pseudomycoides]PHC74072.1 hypothetical protein COF38_18020 [Bacillus pseudomycoides]
MPISRKRVSLCSNLSSYLSINIGKGALKVNFNYVNENIGNYLFDPGTGIYISLNINYGSGAKTI